MLQSVQNHEVFLGLVRTFNTFVQVIQDGSCGFDCCFVPRSKHQLSNTLHVVTLGHQLRSDLEVSVVFRDLLCAAPILDYTALGHFVKSFVLNMLKKHSHTQVFLEIFLSALCQLRPDLFQSWLVEKFSYVESQV